jgi:hypothetical protein
MKHEGLIWTAIFVGAAAVGLSSFWLPSPLPIDAPSISFSAARALEYVKNVAQAPHPTGSPENARVREYLLGKMRELGLNPREMKADVNGLKIINLYGELRGTVQTNAPMLLVSHYDSTPNGPGAADDASGVAACLEAVRALRAGGPLRNGISVLITDGEEAGDVCAGAYAFVRDQANLMKDLRLVVNMEARGNRGPVVMFQTGPDNAGRIQLFGKACPLPMAASFSEEVYRRMPNDTDLTEFLKAGKRGFNFAFTGGLEYYHMPQDTPENLSPRTLQHYGVCVLGLARELGQAGPASLESCLMPGDAIFFTPWRGWLARYPTWAGRLLAWATIGVFVLVLGNGFWRSALRVRLVIASFGVTLLGATLASIVGAGLVSSLVRLLKPSHFGPFVIGLPFDGLFLAVIVIAAAAITPCLRGRLLRRANASEALAGSLIVWVFLTVGTTMTLPGANYLFMWPLFFGTLGLLFTYGQGKDLQRGTLPQSVLTAAPASLLFAPTILLLHLTITIGIAPVSAALVALAVCLSPINLAKGESCLALQKN